MRGGKMFKFLFFSSFSVGLFFATLASATYYCPDERTPMDGCPTSMDHCYIGSTYTEWENSADGDGYIETGSTDICPTSEPSASTSND
jgi:hypothetical protein